MSRLKDKLPGPVDFLLSQVEKLDSISVKILLLELYETMYQIFDHENIPASPMNPEVEARPLTLVAMHAKEDWRGYSGMYRTMAKFVTLNMAKHTGMGLDAFMKLPRDVVDYLFDVATQHADREGKATASVMQAIEQADNKRNR